VKRVARMSLAQVDRIVLPGLLGAALGLTLVGCSSGRHTTPIPPTLTGLSSVQGRAGSDFIISGTGFTDATAVSIGGVEASNFNVLNDSEITAWLASGAQTGAVLVTTLEGSAQSAAPFYLMPVVTGLASTSDPVAGATLRPGDAVTVTGSGFIGATSVLFVGPAAAPVSTAASFQVTSANQITTTAPAGLAAGSGYVLAVVVPGPGGGTLSSQANAPASPPFSVGN
jgi:hypothetical protein